MSATQLVSDLARLGIRIEAHGERLRYSPRAAATPALIHRMKTHKGELLAILQRDSETTVIGPNETAQAWQADAARRKDDPPFPPDALEELQAADTPIADETQEETDAIDPPAPCPRCGTLELWQSLAGNWRCLRCDPPSKARRLREQAAADGREPASWIRPC